MFQLFHFHDVFTCEVVDFSCFILQQENLTYDMKSSEVELWNIFFFITRWALGPSPPSWWLMANKISIRRSNKILLFMYVMGMKCDVGDFDEEMVLY